MKVSQGVFAFLRNTAVIIFLLLAVIACCLQPRKCSCSGEAQAAEPTTTTLSTALTSSTQPVAAIPRLIDLGADKCIPCKAMAPILDKLREDYTGRLDVVFIDVWKNREEGEKYGIRTIPTQIFFDASGKELFRHEGFFSREDILAKWKEFGVVLEPRK